MQQGITYVLTASLQRMKLLMLPGAGAGTVEGKQILVVLECTWLQNTHAGQSSQQRAAHRNTAAPRQAAGAQLRACGYLPVGCCAERRLRGAGRWGRAQPRRAARPGVEPPSHGGLEMGAPPPSPTRTSSSERCRRILL